MVNNKIKDHRMATAEEIRKLVHDNLPPGLASKVKFTVTNDVFMLKAEAVFTLLSGKTMMVQLERILVGERFVACRVPENTLAHLCALA